MYKENSFEIVKDWDTIKCPHCNAEYHPSEIYFPTDYSGEPVKVIKSPINQILYVEYDENKERSLEQHYICDACNRGFVVKAKITFTSEPKEEETDFTELSSSLI